MKPDELVVGKVYFVCGHLRSTYPIPYIDTLVYLGKNIYEDREDMDKDEYIFQQPQKYFGKVIEKDAEGDEGIETILFDDSLQVIKDMAGLIEWLQQLKKNKAAEQLF